MKLDDKDKQILLLLRKNSRAANTEIAKSISLTEGAVRHRINMLITSGMIKKFTIEASSESEVFGLVMIKTKGDIKKAMHEVAALKVADDVYEISGEFDGCAIMEAPNLEELDKKIDEIRKLKNIADTKTFISLKKL